MLKSVHVSPSMVMRVLKIVHASPASMVTCMSNTHESRDDKSQDDDSMPMCLSSFQDDSMPMCNSSSHSDAFHGSRVKRSVHGHRGRMNKR